MYSTLLLTTAFLALGLTVALLGSTDPAPTTAEAAAGGFIPGQLIVTFDHPSAGAFQTNEVVDGASVLKRSTRGSSVLVSVPEDREDTYAARLREQPGVSYVERNAIKHPSFIPNDELFPRQWHLPMVQAPSAWNVTMGDGVVVAVLDTGIAFEEWNDGANEFLTAPDLAETEFVHPYDAVHGNEHPNDDNGHGTHVTGTIAQNTNNGEGVAGMASDVQVMPVKVCILFGCPSFAIAEGITWAVDHGADVINMSLGGNTISNAERDALEYAEDNGVFVVAAAGNGGPDRKGDPYLDYPAAVDTVFSVGAVRYSTAKTPYSNYGEGDGVGLDIVAPGGDLTVDENGDGFADGVLQNTFASLCGEGPFGDYTKFEYCNYQGTSMASPHVAGAAALLLSEHPDMTPDEVRQVLRCSAMDVGDPGYDPVFGYGLLQTADALRDSDSDGTVDCLDATPLALPPFVSIESATLPSGDKATLTLEANVAPPGLAAFAMSVVFDPDIVEPIACETPAFAVCNLHYGDGNAVRVTGATLDPVSGQLTLAEITFGAVATAFSSTLLQIHLDDFANDDLVDLVPDTLIQNGEVIVAPGSPISGDTDCNGAVDALDILALLQYAAGTAESGCIESGDVDCDGDADAVDALKIAQHLASLPYTLPPGCPPIGSPL